MDQCLDVLVRRSASRLIFVDLACRLGYAR